MKGDLRCVEGTLWRHDPQYDDPDHEVSRGTCPECRGAGCEDADDLWNQALAYLARMEAKRGAQ